jgi:hypothetical protein
VKSYEKLMPDSIAKFEIIGEDAIFGLKGMQNQIKNEEKVAPTKVVLELQVINSIYIDSKHCYHFRYFMRCPA